MKSDRIFIMSLLACAVLVQIPETASACGVCTTMSADYYFPFLKFWIPLFLVWVFLLFKIHDNNPEDRSRERFKSFNRLMSIGSIIFLTTFLFSLGSPLVPFIFIFFCWVLLSLKIILFDRTSAVNPEWWKTTSAVMLIVVVCFAAFTYKFQYNNIDRLRKFIVYPGGPHETAINRLKSHGDEAIPVIMEEMVNYEGRAGRKERLQSEGVLLVEEITGKDFGHDAAKVIEWWKTKKNPGTEHSSRPPDKEKNP
ncbi:MAG TPA: hypothetical protein PLN69_11730 [bacterium]|mgnify:CR=1 FL=1|nr:hypothetical protein [bacterium]